MAIEGLIDITLVYSPRAREVLDLPLQIKLLTKDLSPPLNNS